MNSKNVCKWLDAELLPKLESANIIIMDNAKYHNGEIDKIQIPHLPVHILSTGCHSMAWTSITLTPGIHYFN
jgi:hypothetical protein